MRVDMRDVRSLHDDANFTRVLTDMIGAAVFWEGRLCVLPALLSPAREALTDRALPGRLALTSRSPRLLERHYATDSTDRG